MTKNIKENYSYLNKKLQKLQSELAHLVIKREKKLMYKEKLVKELQFQKQNLEQANNNIARDKQSLTELKSQIKLLTKEIDELFTEIKNKYVDEIGTENFNKLQNKLEIKEQIYTKIMREYLDSDEYKSLDTTYNIDKLQRNIRDIECELDDINVQSDYLKQKIAKTEDKFKKEQICAESK